MARKKTKATTRNNIHNHATQTSEPPIQIAHALQVRMATNNSRSPSSFHPVVLVADTDATRMNVRNGDLLMIASIEHASVIGLIIARCEIAANYSPSSPVNARSKGLLSGFIHLMPVAMTSILTSKENPTPSTPRQSQFVATPNNEKNRGFSFRDQPVVETPPSQAKSPAVTPTKQQMISRLPPLWLIPLATLYGKTIARSVCRKACVIQVQTLTEIPPNAIRMVERLILAHTAHRYVQKGESLKISFQGKPLEVSIDNITFDVTMIMENLALADTSHETWTDTEREILELIRGGDRYLSLVTYDTRIQCKSPVPPFPPEPFTKPPLQVAGLDIIVDKLISLLRLPFDRYHFFLSRGMKPPKGVLLHGPTGVGKTLLAKQIANQFESTVCSVEFVNAALLQSQTTIVGEAERQLTRHFQTTSSRGKLLIIDDVHLICPKRGGHTSSTLVDRLTATLLALVDGVTQPESPVVILAITHNPTLLDPALRRPGRLDSEIEVPLPDEPVVRGEILKRQVESVGATLECCEQDDWIKLGKLAKGFNGADCMLAVKEAVRATVLQNLNKEMRDGQVRHIVTWQTMENAIRATKPSAIKSITVEIPAVQWSMIGGMDSVKHALQEAVEVPLQESFRRLGIPAPRGILLYGPPGCSKTLMARALATSSQRNFLAVKGPELLSKWLGESERALASIFRRARMVSPAIIFFDEIDAIAAKRQRSSDSSARMLSQLLTELDGIGAAGDKSQVVIIAATNRPDLLDPALTRPGRIDRMIYVGVPDARSRLQILELSLREKRCAEDVDFSSLAALSEGFSGAELVAICRDAALLALEEHDDDNTSLPFLQMRHLTQAMKSMQRQVTPEMLSFYSQYQQTVQ